MFDISDIRLLYAGLIAYDKYVDSSAKEDVMRLQKELDLLERQIEFSQRHPEFWAAWRSGDE